MVIVAQSLRTRLLGTPRREFLFTLLGLALLGLAVRQAWWSPLPLAAGDWHWWGQGRMQQWFPWPTVWDQTLGFNGQNRFEDAFRFPIYALSGVIAVLGGSWQLAEKLLYFLPYAVLLPIAGWLFAREVMGRTRWTLLAPVILLGSTYLMLEGNVHVPLTIAEAVGLLTLTAFLRAMRRRSIRWAIATGLLLTVAMVFDARPAYLTGLLMGLYLVVLAIADLHWRRNLQRVLLTGLAAVVFGVTQAYWWIPLLAYGHNPHFPTPLAPDFNVMTLDHGIAGVSDFWTGGSEAQLVESALNPMFMLLPLLAFIPLLRRRVRPEVLWLALAAAIAVFLAKTDNPPLGALYDWIYLHIPGFRLFREGSKFLYVVTAAYSVLVPLALRYLTGRAVQLRGRRGAALRVGAIAATMGVVGISAYTVGVLQTGVLDSTTEPTAEPASFVTLNQMLDADTRPGAVMWFGEPVLQGGLDRNHRFIIASQNHSIAYMTGTLTENQVHHRDNFQYFCGDSFQAYCYVQNGVLPYLARLTGAAYAVAPAGLDVGVLPPGISREWIRSELTGMYGTPRVVGSGSTALLVWRLPSVGPLARVSPAIARVESGPWALGLALPALQALNVPAVYTQTLDSADFPAAGNLPDMIDVVPRSDGGCRSTTGEPLAIMAASSAAQLPVDVGGANQVLPRLSTPSGAPGWTVYGPLPPSAGNILVSSAAATLGPCLAWSPLTQSVLATGSVSAGAQVVGSQGERILAPFSGAISNWVEMDRGWEPGWHLGGKAPTTVGDYLVNLYYTGPGSKITTPVHNGNLVFEFSTLTAERVGEVAALLALLASVGALFLAPRLRWRPRWASAPDDEPARPVFRSGFAPYLAGAGVLMIAVASIASAAEWFAIPSRATGITYASDPYRVDIGYDTAGIVLIVLAALTFVVQRFWQRGHTPAPVSAQRSATLVAASLSALVLMLVTSCATGAPSNPAVALQEAQGAGATSDLIVGSSLEEARVQRQARDPEACIADYTEALSAFSTLASAFSGRADCYMSSGSNAPAAVRDYTRAIQISQHNPGLHLRRAIAEVAAGDINSATSDFLRAAQTPSANDVEFVVAIDGLLRLGAYDQARTALSLAQASFPGSGLVHLAAAHINNALNNDAESLSEYAQALPLLTDAPEKARLYADLCRFYLFRLDYAQALSNCRSSVQYTTVGAGSYDNMSVADLALGNYTQALTDINRAIGAFSGNVNPEAQPSGVDGFGLALLLEARARIEVELQDIPSAVRDFQHAATALPPGTPDLAARLKGELDSIT